MKTITENGVEYELRPYSFKSFAIDYLKLRWVGLAICPYCKEEGHEKVVGITLKSITGKLCNVFCPRCMSKFYPRIFPDGNYYCKSSKPINKTT
jgi:hypothetical protein